MFLESVAVSKSGPILEWWITGYGLDEEAVVGVTTAIANYYLLSPSAIYKPTMQKFVRKVSSYI